MTRLVAATLLVGTFFCSFAHAESAWPQFRGPGMQGVADVSDTPLEWSEEKNITWKTPIHGKAWSSPVILGNQVWVTTATEDGRKLSVLCIDKDSGKIIRDLKVFDVEKPQYCHPFNSYASSTPVIEPGRIYVTFGSPGTACLDTETGKVLWERRDFVCNHYRGPGSSPMVHGDLLFMNFDGSDFQYIVALDKKTGKTVWKTDRSIDYQDLEADGKTVQREGDMRKCFSTPRVWNVDGNPLVVSLGSKAFYAYQLDDGKEVWRIEYRGSHSGSATPVIGDGVLYYCTGLGNESLFAVKPCGKGVLSDEHIAWKVKQNVPGKPSPLLHDGRIYMTDDAGIASCVDAKTGNEIWKGRLDGNYSASPVFAGGKIYFCDEDGVTKVIAPGDQFKILAENELEDGFMASPAVADNALFLRTKKFLYRIQQKP